jgi:ubiquinone/menaquinone biosynthesis C-methylase UbiE
MVKNQISRVTRSKNDAQLFYNHISRVYDFSEGIFERKYIQKGIEKLSIQEDDVVLEIGVGTGESIIEFAQLVGPSGKVYGIDISLGMLHVTRKKLKKRHLQQVELICMDAVRLPFHDCVFDKIFMSFTLELFDTPEIPMVLSECFRVIKKNGHIGVVSLSKKNNNAMVNIYEWLHKKFPRTLDCRPIYVREAVQNAGFKIIDKSVISMWGLPIEIVLGESLK